MKNIRLLKNAAECREFLDRHLKTEEFRRAAREALPLKEIFDEFCRLPRLTFEATDLHMERGNFTSWYNALGVREYENPGVNDMYYLHEIAHISTMPYAKKMSFADWSRKLFLNELESSVISEALVYLLAPGLRVRTFKGEIWVDRFLANGASYEWLCQERDRIQHRPDMSDAQEARIFSYQKQNEAWAEIWRERYDEIESHMVDFKSLAERSPEQAAEMHRAWLLNEINKTSKPYPFAKEVEAFAAWEGDKVASPSEVKLKEPQ